jgi:hypothetical protein
LFPGIGSEVSEALVICFTLFKSFGIKIIGDLDDLMHQKGVDSLVNCPNDNLKMYNTIQLIVNRH